VALKELTPEISETTNEADEPSQFLNPARDRILLFSFMKYAIGIQNRDNHMGLTHSPDLPIQHKAMLPEEHPLEPESEIGAACFEPHTALLLQDPLNHDTYDPGKALSRPIGEIGYGNIVLAEKQGTDGRSKVFLAKVTCVMLFEIPQDGDPNANKILQEKTLRTGLGLTLTKHHHIRKHGSIHEQEPGRWRFTNPASDSEWRVAADLDRYPSRSGTSPKPVTRVFNLVLDPPGNAVILTHRNELFISASLGYHMHYETKNGATPGGGMPVFTRNDALQLQGLPEFSRGSIHWRQGAVTRTLDGRLTFDRNRAKRQGPNLFQDQPAETLSIIIDTLPTTEENMRLLQIWKQVSRGWKHHINSYTGPDNHWQRNFRLEIRHLWQAFYRRATAIVQNDRDPHLSVQHAEMVALINDLCTTLETYSYSRALVGGVALLILILTRPNDNFRETLGPLILRTPNPFRRTPHPEPQNKNTLTPCHVCRNTEFRTLLGWRASSEHTILSFLSSKTRSLPGRRPNAEDSTSSRFSKPSWK